MAGAKGGLTAIERIISGLRGGDEAAKVRNTSGGASNHAAAEGAQRTGPLGNQGAMRAERNGPIGTDSDGMMGKLTATAVTVPGVGLNLSPLGLLVVGALVFGAYRYVR